MVFEGLNLGPGAPNSGCGSTGKKVTVNRLRFAIAFPSREYDPENMLFACETAICDPRNNKRLRPDAANLACRRVKSETFHRQFGFGLAFCSQ